jgi:uncharacterized Rmd1/YagE family protein
MRFFNARRASYHTDPKQLEDVIYTPYAYEPSPQTPAPTASYTTQTGDLLGVPELREDADGDRAGDIMTSPELPRKKRSKFDATPAIAEVFVFKYGTVVLWGMTEAQEKRFLSSMYVIVGILFPAAPF